MIIKFSKIISCSSEDPYHPAKNLLEYKSSKDTSTWRSGRPGILESELILELFEPAPITGVDIGNYRCCSVKISGARKEDVDNWITIIEHEFMSPNDAEDDNFKDQVKLFTKKELSEETTKIVFSRIKVNCIQSANLRVTFGLTFLILRTEDKTDTGNLDAFGRFKVKQNKDDSLDKFKEKYIQQIGPGSSNFKTEIAKQIENNRATLFNEKNENHITRKRPSLYSTETTLSIKEEKNSEAGSNGRLNKKIKLSEKDEKIANISGSKTPIFGSSMKAQNDENKIVSNNTRKARPRCSLCLGNGENILCKTCNLLKPEKEIQRPKTKAAKPVTKPGVEFNKLFEGVSFSLSGYKNPERDDIRRKALAMGAKYIFDTDRRNHGCTHLICAFKNTPKYNQLKGTVKIISHKWIEECYGKKTRFPWRRYALDINKKNEPESEDEILAGDGTPRQSSIYDRDTDSDY